MSIDGSNLDQNREYTFQDLECVDIAGPAASGYDKDGNVVFWMPVEFWNRLVLGLLEE